MNETKINDIGFSLFTDSNKHKEIMYCHILPKIPRFYVEEFFEYGRYELKLIDMDYLGLIRIDNTSFNRHKMSFRISLGYKNLDNGEIGFIDNKLISATFSNITFNAFPTVSYSNQHIKLSNEEILNYFSRYVVVFVTNFIVTSCEYIIKQEINILK